MNITHSVEEKIVGDKLEMIFNRQKELMEKYHDIEAKSGLLQTPDCPVNLDDRRGQARIKDFAWRMTEEVGEALDAEKDHEHFLEELIDGLHFLTELSILAGATPEDILNNLDNFNGFKVNEDCLDALARCAANYNSYGGLIENLIKELGMTCNCLKNKPWKQSHMKTDKEAFYSRLSNVWLVYIKILTNWVSAEDITQVYLKKSQVNKFRQRSNY